MAPGGTGRHPGALADGEDAAPNIMQMRKFFVASDSILSRHELSTMKNQQPPGPCMVWAIREPPGQEINIFFRTFPKGGIQSGPRR